MPEPSRPPPNRPNANADEVEATASPEPAAPPPRRRRRWKRRVVVTLVVLLVILAVLVGFAPALASTSPVYNAALALVNARLQGALHVDGVSLSWGGPIEVRGLRVTDPEDQTVVRAERVTAEPGVWRLITSALTFGELTIDAPEILVHQQRDGQITLVQAFQSRVPSPAEPAGALPEPRGRILVKDGTVKVVRDVAGSYEITAVNGQVDLDTLNDVAGKIDLTLAGGARLAGETTFQKLAPDGEIDLGSATGTFRLTTDRKVDVGPLAALAGQAELQGGLGLDVDAQMDAGELQGRFTLGVAGLQNTPRAAANAAPIDAELQGQVRWADKRLTADVHLAGQAGQAQAKLAYEPSDQPLSITPAQILSAVLTGEDPHVPNVLVEAQAGIDLAALGRAVPELLKVRADTELTGGTLEIAALNIQGGPQPAAGATLALKDVTARRGEQSVHLAPLAFALDTALEEGQGLHVRRLELTSGFAQLQASGLASDLRATFQTNLGDLQRELGQVFDFGTFTLAGDVNGSVELKRAGDEQVDLGLQATAANFRYAAGERSFALPRAGLTHAGQFVLADQKLTKVVARETTLDLNGEIVATASGWYDLARDGLEAELALARGDLTFLASRAEGLGLGALERYSGALRGEARAARAAGTQPLQTRGELVVQNLAVDGERVADGEVKVAWDGVELAADGRSVQVATAKLESTLAELTATDAKWQAGETLSLAGKVAARADLARCLAAAAPLAEWDKPPDLAGRLSLNLNGAAEGGAVTLTGQGTIEQFVIGTGATATPAQRVQLEYDARLDPAKESVTIRSCALTSDPLTAEVTGTIAQTSGARQLDLSGRYSASWESITALLHELMPATADTVILAGKSTSEFTVTGPARQPDARPAFRGVRTGAQVTWSSAELYGVKLGAARLAPALQDGRLTLPRTAIPAGDGKVNLGAVVDFQPQDPTLRMAGKLQLLENVAVTKELGTQLLSRINPVFLHVADIQGRVNLALQDVVAPLGESIQQHGAGQGRLDLSQVKIQPGGLLAELLALGGMPPGTAYPVEIGAVDFLIQDGRIRYDNFALTFTPEFDLKFRGSIGLDETLDLVVSVPVRPALLEKLGVKGLRPEVAQALAGLRVDIPVVGTREKPRLDTSKVDVQALLKDAVLKEDPVKQLEGLLRGLQRDRQKKQ